MWPAGFSYTCLGVHRLVGDQWPVVLQGGQRACEEVASEPQQLVKFDAKGNSREQSHETRCSDQESSLGVPESRGDVNVRFPANRIQSVVKLGRGVARDE